MVSATDAFQSLARATRMASNGLQHRPPMRAARVEALQRELGRLEGRLELTEMAESTLREQLQREQKRADQAELEARRLRSALEEARKPERPWWRRMFGG